jgi:hypothetical protein
VPELPVDVPLLREAFPDWLIVTDGMAWRATRRHAEATGRTGRFVAVGRPELAATTPADLAIQLAALEYPLGITPMS